MSNKTYTFSDLLLNEKKNNTGMTRNIVEGLSEKGIEISPRTIQKYRKGDLIPNYQLAKDILDVIGVSLSENELLEVLEVSKKERQDGAISSVEKVINPNLVSLGDSPTLRRRIAIKAEQFTFPNEMNISSDYALELIEERIAEEYGSDKFAFNRYIRDLIDEDMKNNI